MPRAAVKTEIGWLEVTVEAEAVTGLAWRETPGAETRAATATTAVLQDAVAQLADYIAGRRRSFDLPLQAAGNDFARSVWDIMLSIPYGQTLTYGDVARRLGAPAQAVGQACGQNPIAVVIPCHRITGTNWLGGYSSELGLRAKRYLLDLERGQGRLL